MSSVRFWSPVVVLGLGGLMLLSASTWSQQSSRVNPTLEPIAETPLLMNGMAEPNFRGLERLLRQEPANVQAWTFARGQALLIAETANLLMMRPPKTNPAQATWFQKAMQLRDTATELGKSTGNQDYLRSRQQFVNLANACNDCHRSFRVAQEIVPFADNPGAQRTGQEENAENSSF